MVGWVEAPERDFDFAACSVELAPLAVGLDRAAERQRIEQHLVIEAQVNERGFFQLVDVPAGSYEVRAQHPRFAPARLSPVQVAAASETELPLLELPLPAHLTVSLEPATDPYHKRWGLRLHRRSPDPGYLDLVEDAVASEDGAWSLSGLEPQAYRLSVVDSRGAVWWSREVELFPGQVPLPIELPFDRLEGLLTIASEPVPVASVELKEHRGGARIAVTGNEDGKFYVFLPHGKLWDMKVTQKSLGVTAVFKQVTVPPKEPGDRWPKETFEIPDTTIEGEVVDRQGQPVATAALVDLRSQGQTFGEWTKADGTFRFRGFTPGDVSLQARREDLESGKSAMSAYVRLQAQEGETSGPVRLVLEDDAHLQGVVLSATGQGVPGARVVALLSSRTVQTPTPWVPEAHTDLDGVFDLRLPPSASEARLTVYPPGFAVTQTRIELPASDPVIIPVEPLGGTVVVTYEDPPVGLRDSLKANTMLMGRMTLGTQFALMAWAQVHGVVSGWDTFVVPMLEPGPYTACLGPANAYLLSGSMLPPELARRSCASGELAPHGRLDLQIPATAMEAMAER